MSLAEQLYNIHKSVILHESDSIQTCTLLKCWNDMVAQETFIAFTIHDTERDSQDLAFFEKQWPDNKQYRQPTLVHVRMDFPLPIFCKTLEIKMGFLRPQNVLSPFTICFLGSKKLKQKQVLLVGEREATSEYGYVCIDKNAGYSPCAAFLHTTSFKAAATTLLLSLKLLISPYTKFHFKRFIG